MSSKIKVTRIETYDTFGNSHAVNRHETWSFKIDCEFDTDEAAREYVLIKNSNLPQFRILARGLSDDERETFAREFSFGNNHLHRCRWFVGFPPKDRIAELLRKEYIVVERNDKK